MLINYLLLSVALVLLWFPRQWMRTGGKVVSLPNVRRRLRTNRDPNDSSIQWREEFFKLRNWIDLFRSVIGAVAIWYVCFKTAPDATSATRYTWSIFSLKAGVFIFAVVIQTVRYESRRVKMVAPVFFVLGLGVVIIGWIPALFAFIMSWVINRTLPSVSMFLFVFAGLQMAFAVGLKSSSNLSILLSAGLAWLPVFLSLVTHRTLKCATTQRGVPRS